MKKYTSSKHDSVWESSETPVTYSGVQPYLFKKPQYELFFFCLFVMKPFIKAVY